MLGSAAPMALKNSLSPPSPVAKIPGETPHTFTAFPCSAKCHINMIMFIATLVARYPVGPLGAGEETSAPAVGPLLSISAGDSARTWI